MELHIHTHDLRLKHEFRIAHDVRTVQQTVIAELRDGEYAGYGEATASKYYDRPLQSIVEAIEKNRTLIESYDFQTPEDFWPLLKKALGSKSFALCALDVAIHDLNARVKGTSLRDLWNKEGIGPNTCYTIGIDSVERMIDKMREFPWPIYKIKLGTNEDLKIVRELRKHTKAKFRVDANCAWSVGETLRNAEAFKALDVEFIEQPLPAGDWEGMKQLYQSSALPLMADESCIEPADINRCYGHFHAVNIKLMKCGGLTPATKMIEEARKLGLKVMVGCMTESSVGISAIGQLLPQLDYVDMDGFLLIENDAGDGPWIESERIHMPDRPGTGVIYRG